MKGISKFVFEMTAAAAVGVLAAMAAPPRPQAQARPPAQGQPQAESYQHVSLPKELPHGVTAADTQSLQALIDDYRLEEPLVVSKVKDNIYLARGGPGRNVPNAGFVVGDSGVILVDNKNSIETEKAVLAEITKVTSKTVNANIILHSQHESGVAALPPGLMIIAHEKAKQEMEVSTARDKVPSDYFPTKTVSKDETLTIDGIRVRLLHWAPAYTGGDLIAYFPAQKVVFGSDLVVTDFPLGSTFIDLKGHGSAVGWIENVKGMLSLDADCYVSGHGALFTKRDLRTKLAFVEDKWNKVKVLASQGKSLDEVKAALAGSLERNPNMTEVMYTELTTNRK
jgi:glyoxylase-like metal-dependent hydrolase (beta-lactamase superfamily II)